MDKIAIIIVHYNTDEDTTECLKSLSKATIDGWDQKIYVVDNGSKDRFELPYDLDLKGKDVEIIRSEANLGFSGGNNLGITYALEHYQPDYVLLLNSDTLVQPSFLSKLYQTAQDNFDIGLLNPMVYFAKQYEFHKDSYQPEDLGKIIWYAGGSIDWDNVVGFHRGVDEIDRGHFKNQLESEFATGCCVLIKREVLETIGLLDESLFLYWEDVDYSLRARAAGYQVSLVPHSVIWHKNAGSSDGAGSRLQLYYQTRNRLSIAFRYGSWKTKITALRLAVFYLLRGDIASQAVIDALMGKMGKQPIF